MRGSIGRHLRGLRAGARRSCFRRGGGWATCTSNRAVASAVRSQPRPVGVRRATRVVPAGAGPVGFVRIAPALQQRLDTHAAGHTGLKLNFYRMSLRLALDRAASRRSKGGPRRSRRRVARHFRVDVPGCCSGTERWTSSRIAGCLDEVTEARGLLTALFPQLQYFKPDRLADTALARPWPIRASRPSML